MLGAHSLGEHRHHLGSERAPAQPRRARRRRSDPRRGPYVTAALNGDVDNYADLKALDGRTSPPEITTDAKVIPALVARRIAGGADPVEAFRTTVASFEGSVAIAAQVADEPDLVLLAQRGSGQALYVGLAPDAFVVASEPYGLVAEVHTYLRLDGETMLDAGNPASQGQVVVLDRRRAGTLAGIRRCSYDGRELPVTDADVQTPADHDPRRRPRRRAALPPEGDHRGAGIVPQDAARQDRRPRRPARRHACPPRRCPTTFVDGLRIGRDPSRARRSGRARPRSRARASRTRCAAHSAHDRSRSRRRPRPSSRASGCARHARHARDRDLAVGHDDRHQPHRRSRTRRAAHSWSRS